MGEGFDMLSAELAELYGIRSALEGGLVFCGVSEEQFAINGRTYQWPPGAHLTWSLGFSRLGPLSDLDLKQAYTEAFAEIAGCCHVTHEYVSNARVANIIVNVQRLDGPSGVLADMQIPVGNVLPSTQLQGRIDDSEAWGLFENPPPGKIDFYRVALHELLHAHGLGHKPVDVREPALIAPMYDRSIRNLQPADKAELVRRYGQPKVTATPTTPVPAVPPGVKPPVKLEVTLGGQVWIAEGTLKLKQ